MKYPKEKLTTKAYIYGSVFSLANRLQLLGDRRKETATTKQWFAMANIALFPEFELNIKELARIIGTSSQNTKKLVNILIKKNYVMVQKDKADNRNLRIALTETGRLYYAERAEREAGYLDYLFSEMDEEEIDTLYNSLKQFSSKIINKQEDK